LMSGISLTFNVVECDLFQPLEKAIWFEKAQVKEALLDLAVYHLVDDVVQKCNVVGEVPQRSCLVLLQKKVAVQGEAR
jgi:hypothetical protein